MVDRLEIARQYVQEQLEKQGDIVGAFVVGSVARGDATEASDIDLGLIVERGGDELHRGGIDTWRDGVYIEAALASKKQYDDAERVLLDPIAATQMNDALILYDPTGFMTKVQAKVRAGFMEPRWLGTRVHAAVGSLQQSVEALGQAVAAGHLLEVCEYEGWTSLWLASIPLIRRGITPSSTRALIQLEGVSPEWKERICDWEGPASLSVEDVLAMLPAMAEGLTLARTLSASQWGDLPTYMAKKAEWFATNGQHREALHLMWFLVGGLYEVVRATEDPAVVSRANTLVQTWLRAVGWEGQEVLEGKVRMAEKMVAEVEAMAADLPAGEGAGTD